MDPLSLLWARLRPHQERDRRAPPPAREVARPRPGDARRLAPPRARRTPPPRVQAATGKRFADPGSAAAEERRRRERTSAAATSGWPTAADATELSTAAKAGRRKIPAPSASRPRSRRRRRSGPDDAHSDPAAEGTASPAEAATAAGSAGGRRALVGRSAEERGDGAQAFQAPSSSWRWRWHRRLRSGQPATAKLIRTSIRRSRLPNSGE